MNMKAIPTGVYDYRELKQENYYSVDKTLMIKDFLERKSKVTLVTRPRRFGKTINMSMMSVKPIPNDLYFFCRRKRK